MADEYEIKIEDAMKAIYKEFYGLYSDFRLSFHEDGKGCTIYTNGLFNTSFEWQEPVLTHEEIKKQNLGE